MLSLSDAVDPPTWLRILGLVWLPVGFVGTPLAYAVARVGPGRDRARVGLALALVGPVAFVALLSPPAEARPRTALAASAGPP